MTRRRFIAGAGAASAAFALTPSKALATGGPSRRGAVRLLHFTDAHVAPGVARSEALTRRALQIGLAYRPDVVVPGGDAIMDAPYASKADTARSRRCTSASTRASACRSGT